MPTFVWPQTSCLMVPTARDRRGPEGQQIPARALTHTARVKSRSESARSVTLDESLSSVPQDQRDCERTWLLASGVITDHRPQLLSQGPTSGGCSHPGPAHGVVLRTIPWRCWAPLLCDGGWDFPLMAGQLVL